MEVRLYILKESGEELVGIFKLDEKGQVVFFLGDSDEKINDKEFSEMYGENYFDVTSGNMVNSKKQGEAYIKGLVTRFSGYSRADLSE